MEGWVEHLGLGMQLGLVAWISGVGVRAVLDVFTKMTVGTSRDLASRY